jgi:purine-binding chemotaxis protein CheW
LSTDRRDSDKRKSPETAVVEESVADNGQFDSFFAEFDGQRVELNSSLDGEKRQTARELRGASRVEEHLTFSLSHERYGLAISRVREIIKVQTLTFVPRQPPYVRGIFMLRGAIVPVLVLAQRLGLEVQEPTRSSRIVVVEDNEELIGLLVDEVFEVIRLAPTAIEPSPQWKGASHADLLKGVGRISDNMVILLDADALLTYMRVH